MRVLCIKRGATPEYGKAPDWQDRDNAFGGKAYNRASALEKSGEF